jgi:hypothetical protein
MIDTSFFGVTGKATIKRNDKNARQIAQEGCAKTAPLSFRTRLWKKSISCESGSLEENATSEDAMLMTISCWGGVQETPENHPVNVMRGFF